jgi:hypothetical protein
MRHLPFPLLRALLGPLLLTALPLATAAPPPAPAGVSCSFQAAPDTTGRVTLKFTLHNTGPHDLNLLRWGSPFEGGWFGPFVRVRSGAGELPFQGAMRKRGDPSAADYLLLKAGERLAAEVVLDDAYALPPTGPLQLQARWRWHDVMTAGTPPRPRAAHQGRDQDCGELQLTR